MTRLATHNRRGRRRAENEHQMREWIRAGLVVERPVRPGDRLLMTPLPDGEYVDQHGRIWEEPPPSLMALVRQQIARITA